MLIDDTGSPKPDGSYTVTFRLYNTASGGSSIWTEIKVLPVEQGLFYTVLGDLTPFADSLRFDQPYWLGIQVGESGPELSPRIPLTSVGYSFYSLRSDTAQYVIDTPTLTGPAGGDLTGTYPDPTIGSGAVTSDKIQDGAVTTVDLADQSVTQAKLAADVSLPLSGSAGGDLTGTYPNPTIADGAVSSGKIADGTIQRVDVAASFKAPYADTSDYALAAPPGGSAGGDLTGTYPNPTIADGVVTGAKIQDGTVGTVDLADLSVTQAKLAADVSLPLSGLAGGDLTGTYPNPTIADGAVTSGKIADGTIQRVDVAASFKAPYADTSDYALAAPPSGSAGGDLTGTYPNPTIADGAVSTTKLAVNAVTSAKIADGTITGTEIQDNSLTATDIATDIISSIDGVSNDGGNVDLVAGSNITITPNDAANTITISATGGSVTDHGALTGLGDDDHPQYLLKSGGTLTGNVLANSGVTIDGMDISAHSVSPSAHHSKTTSASEIITGTLAEARLPQNAIDGTEIEDNSLTASDIATDIVSSINSVTNDGGNVDLVAGPNITITPDTAAHTITITASTGGGAGDGHSLDAVDGAPTDVVFVDDAGNVGIGTTTPGAKLHVDQSAAGDIVDFQTGGSTAWNITDAGIVSAPMQSSCRAWGSTTSFTTASTWTKVAFPNENWDLQNEFDSSTNYRFTASVAGLYSVKGQLQYNGHITTIQRYGVAIYKNGSVASQNISTYYESFEGEAPVMNISDDLNLAAGDTIDIYGYTTSNAGLSLVSDSTKTYVAIHKVL